MLWLGRYHGTITNHDFQFLADVTAPVQQQLCGLFSKGFEELQEAGYFGSCEKKISGTIPLWIQESNPFPMILQLRSNTLYESLPWQLSQFSHLYNCLI
jgi:hypothetical protein